MKVYRYRYKVITGCESKTGIMDCRNQTDEQSAEQNLMIFLRKKYPNYDEIELESLNNREQENMQNDFNLDYLKRMFGMK